MGEVQTKEAQYSACFDEDPVTLGPMTGATFRWNPRRLGMMLARYKFVSKMLTGCGDVAEIGCADGFGSEVVACEVKRLQLFDFDPIWEEYAIGPGRSARGFYQHDIREAPLYRRFDAVYMLDVLEHIPPADEPETMRNIVASLDKNGVFIAGCPSLESQVYASAISRAGHVNCKTGAKLVEDAKKYFNNVFLFCQNDEMLHVGFPQMAHYLFILCAGPK